MNVEKKYCVAPWRGMHVNFNGQIKPCCAANTATDTMFGSAEIIAVKKSIKQGKLHHKYCSGCINREEAGFDSERNWHNGISPNFDFHNADLQEHKPALVDIRWNNTCNLACTYCGSYFSSRWASIVGKKRNQTINSQYKKIIDYISEHNSTVKEVALVGGEPLMMKENDKLIDILPDNVLITVITNMISDFDQLTVPQKLLKRSRVGWSMSFDNIGERFEYVRWGSTWKQLDKNVTTVAKRINNSTQHGGIQAVYSIYNCTRLCELKQYAVDKNINIIWQRMEQWNQLDPHKHNQKIRTLAIAELHEYKKNFTLTTSEDEFVEQQLLHLKNDQGNQDSEFKKFTHDVENKWHPDQKGKFAKLWPELAQAL